ncbi:methyltransferase type 11 [Penicillium nucicola]|uniref:methyltransferase type 11 n=1 Tax=Penicillium nucicola TaxID=1850975 RepID=UPI002544EC3B|nr:methyltransferase type 11 [Penicillium nucicola]KAJ5757798.1 methyltransferase type 11 [Penicillium nucicola]
MPPTPGRISSILRLWGMIWFSICLHWEALINAIRQNGLATLAHPQRIRDAASAKLFSVTSDGFIAYEDTTAVPSLVKAASGVVLELGPGPGNQIHRFDPSLVDQIYGIEPNPHFKDVIDAKLDKHNLRDRYKLIVCGIEDSDILRKEGITEGSLDAVLCIQVLCAVQDPKNVMKEVWKLLKPGGKFIFWEHGWSRDRLTTVAQGMCPLTCDEDRLTWRTNLACCNPAWSTFVGCNLTRNVLTDILNGGEWETPYEIEELKEPFSLMPRIQGVLVKKKV